MIQYPFNEIVIIGELEFEVTGSYTVKEEIDDFQRDIMDETIPYDFEFEIVNLTMVVDKGAITFDGTILLDSLDCWETLEENLSKQLPDLDSPFLDDNDDLHFL